MSTRRLALFDIDGTLTASNEVDDECFAEVVAAELGVRAEDIDWSAAPHITDVGIAHWLWTRHRGRGPSDAELAGVRERFVELMRERLRVSPERCRPIRGALESLARLEADGWTIALATGAWRDSARLKLRAAGISPALPLFAADEAMAREEILTLARDHCAGRSPGAFDRIVSIGDGVWDVRTARRLSLPFVGVGSGAQRERLQAAGASHVIPDLEYTRLADALTAATIPSPATA